MVDVKTPPGTLEAIELMYFAYRAFTDPPDRLLAERGLGRVHHRILYFVGRRPGLSVGELVDTLRVTKQALNAPLRQLMEMGLVGAQVAVRDRRVRRLSLSTEGQRLERRLTATQARRLAKAFDAAGEPATEAWRAVMRGLAAARPGAASSLPDPRRPGHLGPDACAPPRAGCPKPALRAPATGPGGR